jgi:ATP-dependent RNA helicase DDX60
VGSPEKFNQWLASVQKAKNFNHDFISHPHRYSHLRKFFYDVDSDKASQIFNGLSTYVSTKRTYFLHPIAVLSCGGRSLPPDLALEASDMLSLYYAMKGADIPHLDALNPLQFFSNINTFVKQQDLLRYEALLKDKVKELIEDSDSSQLRNVVQHLEDSKVPPRKLHSEPTRDQFFQNLICLVSDLHVETLLVRRSTLEYVSVTAN